MRPFASISLLCLMLSASALAADPATTINVWPTTAPGETAKLAPERMRISVPPAKKQKVVTSVSVPTLEIYPAPKDKDTGASIVILPGGGFNELKMDYEGEDFAVWLNTIGVTGIVVKYRVPQRPGLPDYLPPLQDAERSMSLVRSRAKEWHLDPNRIGLAGFSAGGVPAAYLQTNFDKRSYPAIDDIDAVSCRPDFSVLVYPGVISKDGKLVEGIHVTKQSPPTILIIASSDNHTDDCMLMYAALKAAGVSAELHIYTDGEHGFGMFPSTQPHGTWTSRLQDWMVNQGIIPAVKSR